MRRQSARLLQYKAYHDKQTENEIEAYQKNMLDSQKLIIGVEHCYATRSTTSGEHGYSKMMLSDVSLGFLHVHIEWFNSS